MCPRESRFALALLAGCVLLIVHWDLVESIRPIDVRYHHHLPCRASSWDPASVDGKIDVQVLSLKSRLVYHHQSPMIIGDDDARSPVQVSNGPRTSVNRQDHQYYPGGSSVGGGGAVAAMSRVTASNEGVVREVVTNVPSTIGDRSSTTDGNNDNNDGQSRGFMKSGDDLDTTTDRKRRHARRLPRTRMIVGNNNRRVDTMKPMAYVHIQPSSYHPFTAKYGGGGVVAPSHSRKCVRCMIVYKPCPAADDAHPRRIVLPAPRYREPAANWRGLKYGECVCLLRGLCLS